jgi:hypothetical protein
MKRKIAITLILAFSLFMILPSVGHSWHRGYPGHYYGNGHYYGHGYYYDWVPAAIIAGTFLTSAIIMSATNNRNVQPSHQPPPAYVGPGPTVYYPPSSQPYAAPYPESVAKYGNSPTGEWVTIPGQWVGDTWVPQHQVFVSTNP